MNTSARNYAKLFFNAYCKINKNSIINGYLKSLYRLIHKKIKGRFTYSHFPENSLSISEINSLSKIKIKRIKNRSLCCVWHIYKPTDIKYFLDFLSQFPDIDHYATLNLQSCGEKFLEVLSDLNSISNLSLYPSSNRGRDFRMMTKIFPDIIKNNYKLLTKVHFKERDHLTHKRLSRYKALSIIKKHIQLMKFISSQGVESKIIYGFDENILDQSSNIGENEIWIKKLCNITNLRYNDFLNSQFISGGVFIVSQPSKLFLLSAFIKDRDFESEKRNQFDGLLCHALERFVSFYAITIGYKINRITSRSNLT
jgi:hypothetical protein